MKASLEVPARACTALLLASLIAACGGDDGATTLPSPVSEGSIAGHGASESALGTTPIVAAQTAQCVPKPELVEKAERFRAQNANTPKKGQSWRELLLFFGVEHTDNAEFPAEPVTVETLRIREGRWSGWRQFRVEAERLIACGWTPGVQNVVAEVEEETTPKPQQAPPEEPPQAPPEEAPPAAAEEPYSAPSFCPGATQTVTEGEGSIVDNGVVDGDRCATAADTGGTADLTIAVMDDDMAYIDFRKRTAGGQWTTKQSGNVEVNLHCQVWYDKITGGGGSWLGVTRTQFDNGFCGNHGSDGSMVWMFIPWIRNNPDYNPGQPGSRYLPGNYPAVDCSNIINLSNADAMVQQYQTSETDMRTSDIRRLCRTWGGGTMQWTMTLSKAIDFDGANLAFFNYGQGKSLSVMPGEARQWNIDSEPTCFSINGKNTAIRAEQIVVNMDLDPCPSP